MKRWLRLSILAVLGISCVVGARSFVQHRSARMLHRWASEMASLLLLRDGGREGRDILVSIGQGEDQRLARPALDSGIVWVRLEESYYGTRHFIVAASNGQHLVFTEESAPGKRDTVTIRTVEGFGR